MNTKPSPLFLKILVITFFILSVAAFVAYRSGFLDTIFSKKEITSDMQKRNNSLALDSSPPSSLDSPPAPVRTRIMSSSKSMILTDDTLTRRILIHDKITTQQKNQEALPRKKKFADSSHVSFYLPDTGSYPKHVTTYLPGSKSGFIIKPPVLDSIKTKK